MRRAFYESELKITIKMQPSALSSPAIVLAFYSPFILRESFACSTFLKCAFYLIKMLDNLRSAAIASILFYFKSKCCDEFFDVAIAASLLLSSNFLEISVFPCSLSVIVLLLVNG